MIIQLIYLFSGLAFMAICWIVAKRQVIRPIHFIETDRRFLIRYLFSPASFTEATAGVVGSTISFYITVFTSFCLSFGWGSIFIAVLVPSIPVSFYIFYRLVGRVVRDRLADRAALGLRTAEQSVTFMDFLLRRHGSRFGALFCVVLMLAYIVSTVAAEMDSLQILYQHLTWAPDEIIQRSLPQNASRSAGGGYKFGFAILLCSLGYVLRGGYPGIMQIDRLQVALIAGVSAVGLVWIILTLHPLALIRDQFLFLRHSRDILTIGLSAFFLIVTWIPAALDNWLRIAGSMIDRIKDGFPAGDPAEVLRTSLTTLRRSMISATLLTTLVTVVPALLGLQIRAHAIDVWSSSRNVCVHAVSSGDRHGEPTREHSFVDAYLSQNYLLVANEQVGGVCGDWLAPNTRIEQEQGPFNVFTSSVYDIFSLALADQWAELVERGSAFSRGLWILVSIFLAVSVICATITTVNSYLLCTAQLIYRQIVLRPGGEAAARAAAPLPAPLLRWWWQPLGATLLISLPIAFLVQSDMLREDNYISYGIFRLQQHRVPRTDRGDLGVGPRHQSTEALPGRSVRGLAFRARLLVRASLG